MEGSPPGLPHDPAISLLGVYSKDIKTGYPKGICILMFLIVLFTIFLYQKIWNNLSVHLWMKRRCGTYIHRNIIQSWKWRKSYHLRHSDGLWVLSEMNQTKGNTVWNHLCVGSINQYKAEPIETVEKWLPGSGRGENTKRLVKGYFQLKDEKGLSIHMVIVVDKVFLSSKFAKNLELECSHQNKKIK